MNANLRFVYHRVRPALIWLGPSNPVMRCTASILINGMCRTHGTKVDFNSDHIDLIKDHRVVRISPRHWIYCLTLSKDFDVYFNCVDSFEEHDRQVVDFSKAKLQRFSWSGLQFEVASFPEEEKAILDYFRWYRPKPGEMVFDLGANCGLSTYYLSQAVGPAGKVIAFEPDPTNHDILLRNIARHGLANVLPLRQAVAAQSATVRFYSEGTIGSTLAHQSNRATTGSTIEVEAVSLADACRKYGTPSFIKMDIEGAELEVLASSRSFLSSHDIHFAIDTNHYKDGRLTSERAEALLRDCGYQAFSSSESGFATTWARKRPPAKDTDT